MARYRLIPRARDGLRRIVRSVETEFGPETARRVTARISHAFDLVAQRPLVGHRRPDLIADPRVRFWSVGQTLIAFRPLRPAGVEILIVERADRDWERLLDDD